jgi:3-mercaptopyruvate sulfurtransferase SseA
MTPSNEEIAESLRLLSLTGTTMDEIAGVFSGATSRQRVSLPYLAYTVCCVCKRVRLYGGVWLEWGADEGYEVSHGLCPDCFRERYGEDE